MLSVKVASAAKRATIKKQVVGCLEKLELVGLNFLVSFWRPTRRKAEGRLRKLVYQMFFIHFLEHVLTLHPSFFGSHVKEYLTQKLLDDVEGICTGDYYIVCVMDTYDISEGRIIPGSGMAEYTIMYRAIVWKPFKGETVRFL